MITRENFIERVFLFFLFFVEFYKNKIYFESFKKYTKNKNMMLIFVGFYMKIVI